MAAEPLEGDLTMFYCGGVPELKVSAHDDQQAKPLIPPLLDAKLTTMHGHKMLFKGSSVAQTVLSTCRSGRYRSATANSVARFVI